MKNGSSGNEISDSQSFVPDYFQMVFAAYAWLVMRFVCVMRQNVLIVILVIFRKSLSIQKLLYPIILDADIDSQTWTRKIEGPCKIPLVAGLCSSGWTDSKPVYDLRGENL